MNKELWHRFLWSFALSDHLGDALEAVLKLDKVLGFGIPEDVDGLEGLLGWLKEQGVKEGIWTCANNIT